MKKGVSLAISWDGDTVVFSTLTHFLSWGYGCFFGTEKINTLRYLSDYLKHRFEANPCFLSFFKLATLTHFVHWDTVVFFATLTLFFHGDTIVFFCNLNPFVFMGIRLFFFQS